MRVRPVASAGQSAGQGAGRPVPWQLLGAAGLTWLVLLPVSVLLSDDTGFGLKLLHEIVAAVAGTAFAVLVGGLVIDAWKAREQRAVAARQAAGWDRAHAELLGAALGHARQQVADTVATCYRLVRELAVDPDGPDAAEVADAIGALDEDDPVLRSARAESARLYGALVLVSDDRARVLLQAGPRTSGSEWDPAAVDETRIPAFLDRATAFGVVADRRLGEVEQGVGAVLDAIGEDDPQLLLLAHQLRSAAAPWRGGWSAELFELPEDVVQSMRAKDLGRSLLELLGYGADLAARLTERATYWSGIFELTLDEFLGRGSR
jgi:hypothetical protein